MTFKHKVNILKKFWQYVLLRFPRVTTFLIFRGNIKRLRFLQGVGEFSQMPLSQLVFLYDRMVLIERFKKTGAFVECGVWRGGLAVLFGKVVERGGGLRKIWLFDSFVGMPEPQERDGENALRWVPGKTEGRLIPVGENAVSVEEVQHTLFTRFALREDVFEIRKGWFQDALPANRESIGKISLLVIDADWYDSVKCCLDNLYDNVVGGGLVFIDDYFIFDGALQAVNEFAQARNLKLHRVPFDIKAVYFIKPD